MDEIALTVAFGRVLRRQRKSALLTQEQLGLAADVQRNYVSELERGLKQASVVTMFKLVAALQLAPAEFAALVSSELEQITAPETGSQEPV